MTPFVIGVLLHYYTRCGDCPACVDNVPIWPETRDWLIAADLLVPGGKVREATYELTPRGHAYVRDGICAVPLPDPDWVIPWPR
jgi:hypothetical protein